jgi:hypothetical protein
VNPFVEECRREWRRLGVPLHVAEEMAGELEADLADAEADGVSALELLGTDTRAFAAAWADARGVVPAHPRRRLGLAVGAAVVAAGIVVSGALVLVTQTTSPHRASTTPTVVGPDRVVGGVIVSREKSYAEVRPRIVALQQLVRGIQYRAAHPR